MKPREQPAWAEHPDLVAFYSDHRQRVEDLYPSERKFLPWLARRATSILDVGCAAGGFVNVWRSYRPGIRYTGVDLSRSLIGAARQRYPDVPFEQGDCAAGLPFPDAYADVVQALGWLHWEPRYAEALAELWRLARRYLFFDVRLVAETLVASTTVQRMALAGPWDGRTTTPYVILPWPTLAQRLMALAPVRLWGYGYWGKPAETVQGIEEPVCFAVFVVEKRSPAAVPEIPEVALELPFAWLETWGGRQVSLGTHGLDGVLDDGGRRST